MNVWTNVMMNIYLKLAPPLHRTQIESWLLLLKEHHHFRLTNDRIIFSDLNISRFFILTRLGQQHQILLKDIIEIFEPSKEFICIVLRSGYLHTLSKNSSIRLHCHLFESAGIIHQLEIFLYNSVAVIIRFFFLFDIRTKEHTGKKV